MLQHLPIAQREQIGNKMNNEWFSQAYGSELIAEKYGISREDMDFLGYTSHMRASQSRNVLECLDVIYAMIIMEKEPICFFSYVKIN